MTELRAHAERQIVVHGGLGRHGDGHRTSGRIGAGRVEQHDLLLGDFQEKARGLSHPVALDAPVQRVGEPQPLFRPRDADIEEPSLLLELLWVVHGPRVREDAFLHSGEKDRGELESLGRVEGHEGDALRVVVEGVHVRHEGDRIEESFEGSPRDARQFLGGHELLGGRHQLLDVLEPRIGLGRALRLEGIAKAGATRHLVDERRHRHGRPPLGEAANEPREVLEGAARLWRHLGGQRRARRQEGNPPRPGGPGHALERGLADAATGRRDGAAEGDVVGRVDGEAQVGDHVLDLAPLVKTHPAHDDVGDARSAQRVLEDARLGVGAVEQGDVAIVQPLAVQRPDRLRHPARFLVFVPRAVDLRPLALGVLRPEALLPARAVVRDDG